ARGSLGSVLEPAAVDQENRLDAAQGLGQSDGQPYSNRVSRTHAARADAVRWAAWAATATRSALLSAASGCPAVYAKRTESASPGCTSWASPIGNTRNWLGQLMTVLPSGV